VRIAYVCADPGIPLLGYKGASVHLRSLAAALVRRGNRVLQLVSRVDGDNPGPSEVTVGLLTESLEGVLEDWGCEVVLERYSLASERALAACRILGIPYALELNAPLVDEAAAYRGLRDVERWRSRECALLKAADLVVAVSPAVRDHALRCGVLPEKAVVIRNGVDTALFQLARPEPILDRFHLKGSRVVGFVGSLKPWHGVDLLLQAIVELDADVRALIVGDGPQRAELETVVARLGLSDRVVFTGAVAHAAVPDHMAAMTLGVAPYRGHTDFYFSPLKVAEYMAAGLPVVASRQGELSEIVGDAGLLVNPDDVKELAEAMSRILADDVLRSRMQQAARQRAEIMTWDQVAAQVEAALASTIAARAQGSDWNPVRNTAA
jgi:glycosyltransferase involved in cell wall biosynthesis